ncbi:MAG: right-handed parallel beta-helix repeat-containing protein [Phycisphaerae bacterium]|nr:right-handed parallel beta-helix repeat-containing protein [Phycisphaerae bacterium]
MGYPVFYGHRSVFFVGGNGTQAGRTAYAGGCTQDWWDGQCPGGTDAEKTAAMGKLMVNGGPFADEAVCAFTGVNRRITKTGCFAGVEAGMVAYVVETPVAGVNIATMRYAITEVDPAGDWIVIGDATGTDATVTAKVGGAFDTLQNALDETDASCRSVTIYTNLNETPGASIDVDTGGSVMCNTFKRVVGFGTVPGDMGIGGGLYQSALSILQAGAVDAGRCVTLDAGGGARPVVMIDGAENFVLENLHLRNNTVTDAIYFAGAPRNIVLRNCRFSGVQAVIDTAAEHVLLEGCYSDDSVAGHHFVFRGQDNVMLGCAARMAAGTNLANFFGRSSAVIGCILVGGQFGVRGINAGAGVLVLGSTFYNTGSGGIVSDTADAMTVINNVFCLAPGAVGIYVRTGGSVVHNDYNAFIASDGSALTPAASGCVGGEAPAVGPHSLRVDPQFADATHCDFRVRNAAILRGGRPGPDGRATAMGAIGQEAVGALRARMMNAGRAGILR